MNEKGRELISTIEELSSDNTKIQIEMDEMRAVYSGKLMEFMRGGSGGKICKNIKI